MEELLKKLGGRPGVRVVGADVEVIETEWEFWDVRWNRSMLPEIVSKVKRSEPWVGSPGVLLAELGVRVTRASEECVPAISGIENASWMV